MANRQEIEEALKTGHRVHVFGKGAVRSVKELPPAPADGEDALAGVVVRTPDGRLTHDGMQLAIREGGSVAWGGEIHTGMDTLPDEAELARGDERQTAAARDRILKTMASLQEDLLKLDPASPRMAAPPDTVVVAQPDQRAPLPETSAPERQQSEGNRRQQRTAGEEGSPVVINGTETQQPRQEQGQEQPPQSEDDEPGFKSRRKNR